MSRNTIFNNKYIGWILFIMVIVGYSAYWVDNNRDFNTVIFDENNKLRDIKYIAKEYHKLFKDTDWEGMPEFKPFSDEELSLVPESQIPESQITLYTESTNNDLNFLAITLDKGDNSAILSSGISFSIDSTNSIEDIITNLKAGFEILEKAYPKDRELLDKIYTEIPMHFTKYTNQENYQEKEYNEYYYSVLEDNNMEFHQIYIFVINKEYHLSMSKFIAKEGE